MNNKELLKWIEFNLVKPYEGVLQFRDSCCVALHEKVTGHTREKFNELTRMLGKEKIYEFKNNSAPFELITCPYCGARLNRVKLLLPTSCQICNKHRIIPKVRMIKEVIAAVTL